LLISQAAVLASIQQYFIIIKVNSAVGRQKMQNVTLIQYFFMTSTSLQMLLPLQPQQQQVQQLLLLLLTANFLSLNMNS